MTIEQHLQLLFVVPGRDVERPVASMPGELWTATVTVLQQASLHTAVGNAA